MNSSVKQIIMINRKLYDNLPRTIRTTGNAKHNTRLTGYEDNRYNAEGFLCGCNCCLVWTMLGDHCYICPNTAYLYPFWKVSTHKLTVTTHRRLTLIFIRWNKSHFS